MNKQTTMEKLLGAVFTVLSAPSLYKDDQLEVEVGSRELQVSSGSLWPASMNLFCLQSLHKND
jgi:hypothetical protein